MVDRPGSDSERMGAAVEAEQLLRLMIGMAAGLVIGWQRTVRHKNVGIRTFGLVGLGTAAVSSLFSETLHPDAASRIVQGVLTGIGFLGAGLIIRRNNDLMPHGLTTAAAIWVTAALGCAAGLGHWQVAGAATVLALVLLFLDHSVERWVAGRPPPPKELRDDGPKAD
jgi:putative Mg2+ transporter-C (MgtC) family protein